VYVCVCVCVFSIIIAAGHGPRSVDEAAATDIGIGVNE